MKYILLFIVFVACSNSALCQVKYKGITKLPLQQTLKNINGSWNNADHTGNAAMDKLLDKLVGAYKTKSAGIKALEGTAAEIKADPVKFINANGTVNKEALKEALSQQFKSTGEVSIPALKMVDEEEDDLR